jgi:hypothetical protein
VPLGNERGSGSAVRFPVSTTRLILVAAIVLPSLSAGSPARGSSSIFPSSVF